MSTRPRTAREPRAATLVAPVPAARGKSPRALLDVDVLIALLDADHLHHRAATRWLEDHLAAGWASCAITQNGCVRIMSQSGYPNPLPTAQVAQRLAAAAQTPHHRFIAADESLLDARRFDSAQLLGPRQVTDAWLLGLAVAHDLRFVTFDKAVPLRAVHGATAAHVVTI